MSVTSDASKDAAAVVAALYKGDSDSAELLMNMYTGDSEAQAALCGSLAAFATAVLHTVDAIRAQTDDVTFPSGENVLKSVLTQLASEDL